MSDPQSVTEAGTEARRKNQAIKEDAKKIAGDVSEAVKSSPDLDKVQADVTHAQADVTSMFDARRAQLEAYVRESPWTALGIAFGVGFVLGMRRR